MKRDTEAGIYSYVYMSIEDYVKGKPLPANKLQINVSVRAPYNFTPYEGKKVKIYLKKCSEEDIRIFCGDYGIEEIKNQQSIPHYEPVTEVEYPGSPINVTLPTIPPNQSLMPLPYHPFDRFPEPGAKDVPLDTYISVSFPRPPSILKLEIEPDVKIGHVKKELILYSGKYTFYPAKPLQSGTNYTITITAGQREPPGPGFAPTLTTSWQFTTISKQDENP